MPCKIAVCIQFQQRCAIYTYLHKHRTSSEAAGSNKLGLRLGTQSSPENTCGLNHFMHSRVIMNQSHKTAVTLMSMADSFALKYAEHMISGQGQETRMKQGSDTATPHNKSQHLRLDVAHHNKCELQCDAKYALHSSVTTRKLHISKILAFPAMAIEESPVLCMAIVGRERRHSAT